MLMKGKSIHKVEGGKLLRVYIEYEKERLQKVTICGDFFLYPEEKIKILEKEMSGLKFTNLQGEIGKIIKRNNLIILGFDSQSLAQAILEAR